ncbi:hypothetical protein P691DRAFT_801103 [Macrolepiota fuliginosa MF-IS2]|uniref:Uncharacterized protein n=1 Tax=Macrolepiota fuliginosa MF-IS2 TaxID=1400762 RepID=A0A9P5XB99_9AGAR|nr:hypothetical protein P691DRAFT_801103 [Macrolepiota fuliginosa MF-IS2]
MDSAKRLTTVDQMAEALYHPPISTPRSECSGSDTHSQQTLPLSSPNQHPQRHHCHWTLPASVHSPYQHIPHRPAWPIFTLCPGLAYDGLTGCVELWADAGMDNRTITIAGHRAFEWSQENTVGRIARIVKPVWVSERFTVIFEVTCQDVEEGAVRGALGGYLDRRDRPQRMWRTILLWILLSERGG